MVPQQFDRAVSNISNRSSEKYEKEARQTNNYKQERRKIKHECVVNALFWVFLPQNGGAQWEFMKEIYIQRTRELMIRREQSNGGSMNVWKTEHLLHVHFFMMEKVGKSNNG